MSEIPEAKHAFQEIFPQVVRTGSHFYEWLSYTKAIRGFGKIVREAGKTWSRENVKELAYQLLKYQQRQGFSHQDALRLFHVKAPTEEHNQLFQWALQGWEELPQEIPSEALAQIWWYEWLKRHPDQTHEAIAKASNQNFGGTDASVAYDWAMQHKFKADVFCFWTDCESWAGRKHPSQALAEYRRKVNPNGSNG